MSRAAALYSLNKLESYSRISALGPVGHCTIHFKRAVCISCGPRVGVHKRGPAHVDAHVGRGRGVKNLISCGHNKWMTPKGSSIMTSTKNQSF